MLWLLIRVSCVYTENPIRQFCCCCFLFGAFFSLFIYIIYKKETRLMLSLPITKSLFTQIKVSCAILLLHIPISFLLFVLNINSVLTNKLPSLPEVLHFLGINWHFRANTQMKNVLVAVLILLNWRRRKHYYPIQYPIKMYFPSWKYILSCKSKERKNHVIETQKIYSTATKKNQSNFKLMNMLLTKEMPNRKQ